MSHRFKNRQLLQKLTIDKWPQVTISHFQNLVHLTSASDSLQKTSHMTALATPTDSSGLQEIPRSSNPADDLMEVVQESNTRATSAWWSFIPSADCETLTNRIIILVHFQGCSCFLWSMFDFENFPMFAYFDSMEAVIKWIFQYPGHCFKLRYNYT